MASVTEQFDTWCESRFGRQQLEVIDRLAEVEHAERRAELVEEIEALEKSRDDELAQLAPKIVAAAKRATKADCDRLAAHNAANGLRRLRSDTDRKAGAKLDSLRRELATLPTEEAAL